MKIYPSSCEVIQTDSIKDNLDIPLCYIQTDYKDYEVKIDTMINKTEKKPVIPYQKFDSYERYFFDENNQWFHGSTLLSRYNNQYIYYPNNLVSFEPIFFSYRVVCKKNIPYLSTKKYNIKVATMIPYLCDAIMPIAGDAYKRGMAPANIKINNGDLSRESLLNSGLESDIVFIESEFGGDLRSPGGPTFQPGIVEMLSEISNASLWIMADPRAPRPRAIPIENEYYEDVFKDPQITVETVKYKSFFDLDNSMMMDNLLRKYGIPKEHAQIINPFKNNRRVPAFILEIGKTMIMFSTSELFMEADVFHNVIYELMFYLYSKSYTLTEKQNEWICENIPDYECINNELIKKDGFVSKRTIHDVIGIDKGYIIPIKVLVEGDKANIISGTITYDNRVEFSLDKTIKDPANGKIKIYTHKGNIVICDNLFYAIEEKPEISYSITDGILDLKVKPFKSTDKAIVSTVERNFEIELQNVDNYEKTDITDKTYQLYTRQNTGYISIRDKVLDEDDEIIIIAEIHVTKKVKGIELFDMRSRGGGAKYPYEYKNCLLDNCNALGWGYRPGGAVIITLPKKVQKYNELIYDNIKKHCQADEEVIIIYKDKENE